MFSTFNKIAGAFIWLTFNLAGMAQVHAPFSSAYNAGMLSSDHFSSDRNVFVLQPSVLSHIASPSVSTHMQSLFSGFGIYALGLHIATDLPLNFGAGLSIVSLGHPDYKSNTIIVSTAKQLSNEFSIGISQNLQRTKVVNEGRPWTGFSTIGGMYDNGDWGLAIHFTDLAKWGLYKNGNKFSVNGSTYYSWPTKTYLYFLLEYTDQSLHPVSGIRQVLIKNFEVFGSFQWYPARYGLGFSLHLSEQWESTLSTQYHPVLGWSPAIGLQWQARKKKD